jgi:hypothetical protein
MTDSAHPDVDIAAAIQRLVAENGEIDEALYDCILELCKYGESRAADSKIADDPRDLAGDFLLHIRKKGAVWIKSKGDLRRALDKFKTASNAPEAHQLWGLISAALRQLEEDGECSRSEAERKHTNKNTTLWTPAGFADCQLDNLRFDEKCKSIPSCYPKVMRRTSQYAEQVITATKAFELVKQIFEAAEAPLMMSRIVDEAMKHVFLCGVLVDDADDDGNSDEQFEAPARVEEVGMRREAEHRAGLVWKDLDMDRGRKVLCLYILPSDFLKCADIKMADLGAPQTISDIRQKVFLRLRPVLEWDPFPGEDPEVARRSQKFLTSLIFKEFIRHCTENDFNVPLEND